MDNPLPWWHSFIYVCVKNVSGNSERLPLVGNAGISHTQAFANAPFVSPVLAVVTLSVVHKNNHWRDTVHNALIATEFDDATTDHFAVEKRLLTTKATEARIIMKRAPAVGSIHDRVVLRTNNIGEQKTFTLWIRGEGWQENFRRYTNTNYRELGSCRYADREDLAEASPTILTLFTELGEAGSRTDSEAVKNAIANIMVGRDWNSFYDLTVPQFEVLQSVYVRRNASAVDFETTRDLFPDYLTEISEAECGVVVETACEEGSLLPRCYRRTGGHSFATDFAGAGVSRRYGPFEMTVSHDGSDAGMEIDYRGRRRGLHFVTARPVVSDSVGWHRARDAICAAGGSGWRVANLAEALGGGAGGQSAAIGGAENVPGLSAGNSRVALAAARPEHDENVLTVGGIVLEHGTAEVGGENAYLQLSPDAETGAPVAVAEQVHLAATVQPVVCVREIDSESYVRPAEVAARLLQPMASAGLTLTALFPVRPGSEFYEDAVYVFASPHPRFLDKTGSEVIDADAGFSFSSPADYPVAEVGFVGGRTLYGIRVNPGSAYDGLEIPVSVRTENGARESFVLRVSVSYVARVESGLSFGGNALGALEDGVRLEGLRNVLDGSSGGAELRYFGVRRGLHVARTTLDFADGWQESACAAGSVEGWRVPDFAEVAGLALGVGDEVLDYGIGDSFMGGGRMAFGVGSLERNYRPGLFADVGTNLLSSRNFAPAKYPRPPAHAGQIQGRRSAEVADIFRRRGIEAAENSAMTAEEKPGNKNIVIAEFRASEISATSRARGPNLGRRSAEVADIFRRRGIEAAENSAMTAEEKPGNKNIVIAEFRASEISATSRARGANLGRRSAEVADIFRRQGIKAAENSAMTALREGASARGGLAWVDVYSDNLRPDGKASAGAGNDSGLYESETARIVCVRPVDSDSYARPGPLGTVSFSAKTRRWLQAAEAPARFTVTAHARRRVRDGSLAGAAEMFAPTVSSPFQVRKLAGDSNDATLAFAVFRSAAVADGNFDLPIIAPLGFRATFVLSVRARSGALVFDGANLFAGAAVAYDVANALDGSRADVTLRYYGPRRGLHYVHSEVALEDGWQEAVCDLDSDWRLPSFGEAAALAGDYLAVVAADAGAVGAGALVNRLAPLPLPRVGDSPPLDDLSGGVFGDFYSSSALAGGLHSAVPAASRLVSGADGFVACVREDGAVATSASPSRAVFLSDDGREVLSGRLAVSSTDSPLLTLEIRGRRYGRAGAFYSSAEGLVADLISDYSAFSASVSYGGDAATMVISGSWPAGYSAQLTVRARPAYGPAADFAAVVGGTETSLDYVAPPPLIFNGTTLTSPGTRITTATEIPHVLEYLGRRRGLHFAAEVESTPHAGADKLAACSADGWRLPSLTELAGLLRDGTSATLGAFALRGGEKIPGVSARQEIALNAEPDSYAPQASTLSGNAPLALDLQSNLADSSAPEFHRSVFVLPDSLALYSAGRTDANRSARLVCVKVAAENYAGANHFSEVSFEVDGEVATTGAASLVAPRRTDSFYEVEVVSRRPQVRVDGAQDDDVFAELVDSPSGYGLSYADGRAAFQMNPHELDSIAAALTLRVESGPMVREFSLEVNLLAAVRAGGRDFYYPSQRKRLARDFTYGGRRRGLHWGYFSISSPLPSDASYARPERDKEHYCSGFAPEPGWRLPSVGELLGLLVDDADFYVLREGGPAITALRSGLRIPLPSFSGSALADGPAATDVPLAPTRTNYRSAAGRL